MHPSIHPSYNKVQKFLHSPGLHKLLLLLLSPVVRVFPISGQPSSSSWMVVSRTHTHSAQTHVHAGTHAHIHCAKRTETPSVAKWQTRGALIRSCRSLALLTVSRCSPLLSLPNGVEDTTRTCLSVYVCGWLRVSFPHSILVGLFSVSSLMSCVTTSSRPFSGLRLGDHPLTGTLSGFSHWHSHARTHAHT